MIYIEASPHVRLRPSHVLLMIYRYTSGVYQAGDLSALNYLKGFLEGSRAGPEDERILTVSGHGVGEAERWLVDRFPSCEIDTVGFRLIDTQLLHVLRVAHTEDLATIVRKFAELVAPYEALSELVADPGLVPYWCEQSELIARCFDSGRLQAFSDSPLRLPASRKYDLIYVGQAAPFFSAEAAERLRAHVRTGGLLAALLPAPEGAGGGLSVHWRFASSTLVAEAKAFLLRCLERRGYSRPRIDEKPTLDLGPLMTRRETIPFNVLAPASAALLGELILFSLNEHISDRHRLEILNETMSQFRDLQVPVNEALELCMMEADA